VYYKYQSLILSGEALNEQSKRRGNWGGNRKLVIPADTDSQISIKNKFDERFEGMEERPINNF